MTSQSFHVLPVTVKPRQLAYVTTYEFPHPAHDQHDDAFASEDADQVCQYVISQSVFTTFELPVCSAAAVVTAEGVSAAVLNPASQ